jgi:hypothetical protein
MNAREILKNKIDDIKNRLTKSTDEFNSQEEIYKCLNDTAAMIKDLFPFAKTHHVLSDLLQELTANTK